MGAILTYKFLYNTKFRRYPSRNGIFLKENEGGKLLGIALYIVPWQFFLGSDSGDT